MALALCITGTGLGLLEMKAVALDVQSATVFNLL
jgi:hypothetical protein